MSKAIVKREDSAIVEVQPLDDAALHALVTSGNLGRLNQAQQTQYYNYRCAQVGLDPSTAPFDIINMNGKTVLYAKKECAAQLCAKHRLSAEVRSTKTEDGIYEVCARVISPDGRFNDDIGAVSIKGLAGEALCNAKMKATTKAKRRAVLGHCGLGMMDESEIEGIHAGWGGSGSKAEAQAVAEEKLRDMGHHERADTPGESSSAAGSTPAMPPPIMVTSPEPLPFAGGAEVFEVRHEPPSDIEEDALSETKHFPEAKPILAKKGKLSFEVLDRFTARKAKLKTALGKVDGEVKYYAIIAPYQHSNLIQTNREAKEMLEQMDAVAKEALDQAELAGSLCCEREPDSVCSRQIKNRIAAAVKKSRASIGEANANIMELLRQGNDYLNVALIFERSIALAMEAKESK